MTNLNIKFSHNYPKLHGQTKAVLLQIIIRDRKDLLDEFINYDTLYIMEDGPIKGSEAYYPLKPGKYMVLVFIGNKLIPFTTVRALWPLEKEKYYREGIGKTFEIVMVKP
jgi:hypothetical protein